MASGKTDYIGRKYGRLTVTGKSKNSRGLTVCDCLCDCGNRKNNVCIADLKRGHTNSCGCYNREKVVERNKKHIRKTHGNSAGYTPDNCRWSNPVVQTRNRSNTITVEFQGEIRVLADLAEEYGVSAARLRSRVKELGWSLDKALTVKDGRRRTNA